MKTLRSHRTFINSLLIALLTFWQVAQPLRGATFYWDTDTSTAGNNIDGTGLGGTGTWDALTTSNWWNLANLVPWPNTNADHAIFTGPAPTGLPTLNTVTLTSGITANRLSFSRSGYTLTGGDLTLAGTTPTLHANLGESAAINSQILGTAGLTKTGGGSIRLTNNTNGYTGETTISNGSLIISNQAQLGADTSAISILTSNNTPQNLTLYGFGGGSLVLDGTSSGFTLSRNINLEGRGPIGERGAAVISIGNNTLSGTVSSAVSPLAPSTIRNSRINSVNGTLTFFGTLNVGGTSATTFLQLGGINSAGTGNFDLTGVLSGTGSIEKTGGGTLFLNPSSTSGFSGTVRVSGSNAVGQESSIRVTQLTVGGTSIFGANTISGDDPSAIDINGGVLEFRNEGSLNFNSLSSGKNLYHRADGTLFAGPGAGGQGINGTVTLGTYRVVDGADPTYNSRNGYGFTFQAWTQEQSDGDNTLTNNLGGTLLFTGNAWNNSDGSARTLNLNGGGNTTITGDLNTSGAGTKTLAKGDGGTLTLNGTGTTLNGPVNITNGEVVIRDFRSLNNNTATINLGSGSNTVGLLIGSDQVATSGGLTTSKVINLNGTTGGAHLYANQSFAAPVVLNANFTATGAGAKTLFLGGTSQQDNIINGAIVNNSGTNTTAITKIGSGTWVLASGSNSFTGNITVTNGTLKVKANAATSTIVDNTVDIIFDGSNVFAGGTLEFVGQNGANNVETLDVLTPTLGAGKIKLTPGTSGSASLVFGSLGTVGDGATVNIVGSTGGSSVTLTGQSGLNANPRLFFNGSDFAIGGAGGVMRAPVYGTDAGFVNASAGATLPAGADSFSINGNITAQGSQTVDTLKFNGGQTLTLTGGSTLTVRTGAANTDGAILATGGSSTITGGTGITTGGSGSLTFYVNGNLDTLVVESPLTSGTSGGITKSGDGTLILSGNNLQTGTTSILEGTVQLSGSGRLSGNNVTTTIRQGATLDLNGVSTGNAIGQFNNNGIVTNSNATAATLQIGNNNGTGDLRGVIQDGIGVVNVTKVGTGNQVWYNLNTYSGVTTIGSTGLVTVDYLADIGQDSGIGRGSDATNAASLVFNGSTGGLVYRGDRFNGNLNVADVSTSTNRLFTLAAAATGARLSSTVGLNNAIVWSNTAAIVNNTSANATLTFEGDSAGDNTFNPQLVNSSAGGGVTLSVTKTGTGQWNLGNSNNTYTGTTTVGEGILGLNNSGALPVNSPLVLGSAATSGVLQTSGTIARNLTATPTAGTGTLTWGGTTGGGGFAAHSTPLTVTLNGGAGLTWGGGGFVPTGAPLIFGSASALSEVTFTNAIDLGAVVRTVTVNANTNTGSDQATLSGILSGTGGGLLKNGAGVLRLTGANIYTGVTDVNAGTLVVSSLGRSTSPASTPTSVGLSGTDVTFGNTNAITIGNAGTGNDRILQYVGAGETSDRKIRLNATTGSPQIHADGSGPLILTNVANDMAAGAKTLILRGSNTAGNMITSQLSDNGGALSVTVDGAATWILTDPANNYAGNTNVNAGALGIGNDAALGTGTLVFNNGNTFAYGADRTITNAVNHNNNTTAGFLGDYSLTFTQPLNVRAAANNVTTSNSVAVGKTVTFADGVTNTEMTANRAWGFDGPGETVINGNITTTTAFGLRFDINGGGTLTLGTNGATSNWNQSGTAAVDVDRGTLKFTTNNAIPTTNAAYAGIIISPELATTDTATVNLNGTVQTINALTATTDGTITIDNTSATAASFRFGANNTTVNFGSGTGTYTITDSGAGALSIVKLGNTSTTFGSGVNLTYQGATRVEGGSLTLPSAVNGTTALEVANSGSTLALTGGITMTAAITSIVIENGGTLSLLDGSGNKLTGLTNLQLGSSGGTNTMLNLNVGDITAGDGLNTDTLGLLTGGTLSLFAGNKITFNLTDTGLNPNQQYILLSAAGGGLFGTLTIADFLLGATPGGFTSINLTTNSTTNQIILTTGNLITGDLFWRGLAGGGTNDTWNANSNNWSLDKANTSVATSIPGQGTDVIFAINSATGAVTTTLEQNFKINSLTFEAGTTTPTSVTIAPGTITTSRLEVAPQVATEGVGITAGGPATVTISAPFRVGAAQTWTVADAAALLIFNGELTGSGAVIKAGDGRVRLGAAAPAEFAVPTVTVNAGRLEINSNAALGSTANANLAGIIINTGGAAYYNNATGGTLANTFTLGGGTLSAGGANHTYSGTVNVSANSFINMRESASAVLTDTARNITLSGAVSGSGSITLDSINTISAGNQLSSTLTFNNAGNTWSGDLNVLRGTATFAAAASPAFTANNLSFNGFGRTIIQGVNAASLTRTGTLGLTAATIAEFQVDNTSGTLGANYTINQNGAVSLGGGSGLRIFLADVASALDIGGSVTLGGNASISVAGGDADSFATISSIIGDGGSGFGLTVNDDQGGWGQTNTILRLTGANTFTGNVTVTEGTLQFNTVTNISGGASALGNGTALTVGAATLSFIGSASQATDRPITQTGASTYSANGTGGATITYNGAISAAANNFTLTGTTGSGGIITSGITTTGTTDATVNGGTWTLTGATSVGDDLTVTGVGTILNLNSTGALLYNAAASADASMLITNGAVVNLGANNAVVAADFDRLFIAQGAGGATATLAMSTFNLTTSRLILGERLADRTGEITGTGTLTVTGGDIDLFKGTIFANLATTGTTALEKFGPGTVTLTGDNSALASTGATTIEEGTLVLDYTASNTTKVRAASQLGMVGSNLILNGNASAATVQTVASFTLGSGGNSTITLNPGAGQDIVLNLGAITRAVNAQDGTLRIILPSGTQSATHGVTTTTALTNGLVGTSGYITVNDGTGTWFATKSGNNIVALASTAKNNVSTWLVGDHITDETTGFTGTLGKEFTINSLRLNAATGSDLDLGAAGHLRLTSGGILVTDSVGGTPSITGGSLDTASFALPVAASELIITQDSVATFEIGSNLHRAQNVTKSGSGTLLLSGTNTYTGYTEIQNGILQLGGGHAIGDTSVVTLAANRNSTLQLLADETIGGLAGGRRNDNSDYGMVEIGSHTLTLNMSGSNTSYAGRFSGNGTIVRQGTTNNLTLTGVSTGFTGAVIINTGRFELSLSGRLDASSFTVNAGGVLLLNNNGATRTGARILDTTPITLNSANGSYQGQTIVKGFVLLTDQDDTNSETVGLVTANSGASYITVEGTSANDDPNLTMSNLARVSGATVNLRGTNLGSTNTQRGQIRIATANEAAFIATMVGGGSTTAGDDNISIVPWAVGETVAGATADGNMGNSLVTYVVGSGFRPLDLITEYAGFAASGATDNVRETLAADLTALAGKTLNSLVINNQAVGTPLNVTGAGAGQLLTNTSGAYIFTVTGGVASTAYSTILSGFDSGITVGGTNEYVIHVVNPSSATTTSTLTATIASPLTSAADITKSGRGTLILNQINAAGGGSRKTTINEGTLEIADLDNIGGGTGALVFAGGTLRLGTGFADDLSTRTVSFLTGGATLDTNGNNITLANSIGGGGAGSFTKTGAGDVTLNAAASYSGATTFTNGTLTHGVNNALPSGTSLTLVGAATAATLDLNGFNQTVGSFMVATNSGSLTTGLVIDPGTTFTANGNVLIGADAAAATTLFSASGGGSFVVNSPAGTFQLGGGTGTTNTNAATADFSGLASFTVDLGNTGIFRVGDNNANSSGSPNTNSTLTLAGTSNTITAGILGIGDSQGQGGTATLELGAGTNVINADTVYIGAASALARSAGALVFDGAGGSLTLRGSSGGTSRANVAMTTSTINTGFIQTNTFLTAGHTADLRIDSFVLSERTTNTGSVTSTFTFDQGTADITSLMMARRTGAGTGGATANFTIGGGSVTIGSIDMATNNSAGGAVVADLNITSGIVTIGTGSGTAINMANAGTGRTVTSTIDLTGGTVTVTGNIIRTGGTGTENETLTLNGSNLNLSGNSIGTAGANINFAAHSGTLTGLGEFNGGGVLDKTTTGTLTLTNGNTYTGGTTVTAGTLLAMNTTGSATGTGNVTVLTSATLGGTGSVAGNVQVNADGTLAPGASAGQFTIAGNLSVSNAGILLFELGGTTTQDTAFTMANVGNFGAVALPTAWENYIVNTTAHDQIKVDFTSAGPVLSGTIQISPTFLNSYSPAYGDVFDLMDWAFSGAATGTPTFDLPDISGQSLAWDTSGFMAHGILVVVGVIPEPSRALLLMLGLLCLFMRRRRQ